jgi:DNA polymerase III delta subunit
MRVRILIDKNMRQPEIIKALGMRPFFGRLYIGQAGCYTMAELKSALRALLQADYQLKIGYLDPTMTMTLVIHRLVRGGIRNKIV